MKAFGVEFKEIGYGGAAAFFANCPTYAIAMGKKEIVRLTQYNDILDKCTKDIDMWHLWLFQGRKYDMVMIPSGAFKDSAYFLQLLERLRNNIKNLS